MGRKFPTLTYSDEDAMAHLLSRRRNYKGQGDLMSVAHSIRERVRTGFQAAALKPADFFGNDDILYLMEDMATGEIRLSILWEWVDKGAVLTEDDKETGVKAGDIFTSDLFERLLAEEYDKLLRAKDKDVDDSSPPLCPSQEIVETCVPTARPWYIGLLNINLNNPASRPRRSG
jgi:malate synthase